MNTSSWRPPRKAAILFAVTLCASLASVGAARADTNSAQADAATVSGFTASSGATYYDTNGNQTGTYTSTPQTVSNGSTATGDSTNAGTTTTTGTTGTTGTSASPAAGTSQAQGCERIWVKNVGHRVDGGVAYEFRTTTYVCYDRAKYRLSNPSNDWTISNLDGQEQWKGITKYSHGYYSWLSGQPSSGYFHYRMGEFQNCIMTWGCWQTTYPANDIHVHSNSTWKWSATGAAGS